MISTRALDHEDGDHAGLGVHGEIGAIRAVVAEHAVAQMVAEAVIHFRSAGLFFAEFIHSGR